MDNDITSKGVKFADDTKLFRKIKDSRFKIQNSKNFIVRLKNILKMDNFLQSQRKMTVIKTLVNHIGPTVVNTQ